MTRGKKVAVVMSRLRRCIALDEPWLVALRAILRRIASDEATLVVAAGTAGAEFVRQGATRLGISCESITVPTDAVDADPNLPLRDRLVIGAAEVVYVLTLRAEGNIHQLLRERLQQPHRPVILVDQANLQAESARKDLCERGAETWQPTAGQGVPFARLDDRGTDPLPGSTSARNPVSLLAPLPRDDNWTFLTHTTRGCPGPWPDESFDAYANGLLESRPEADHSPLQALRRIVTQRRLIASGRTIRGGHQVISFTACPLERLPSLHRFRPHRVRWDFEPYGLCLRRDWLLSRGARPVFYGNEASWNDLPEADRPFFQLAVGDSGIDWSVEQEWRHLGHVDLTDVTPDDVLLFVPHFQAAKELAAATTWPITLCPVVAEPEPKSDQ